MSEIDSGYPKIHLFKSFWSLYTLTGFFSLAFSGIYILVVPLSSLFWPSEPFHALEMGILITSMFWTNSIAGLFFGRLIDKMKRTKILLIIAVARGFSVIMLSFTAVGRGLESWSYFYAFVFIIGISAGGNYPAVSSLSHDLVPISHRSRFFGIFNITRSSFQLIGYLLTGYLVLLGLWRVFFSVVGFAIIINGFIMFLTIKEPKRGGQRDELSDVLKDESISYKYQIDMKMMRKTMLSKTNLVALVEGIFTSVFMGSLTILFLPYIQTPPHNFSPLATGAFLALFGLTGGFILKILLARFSDKVSRVKHKRRLYFIIIALAGGAISFVILFYFPLPHLSVEEGENILLFFSFPMIWIMGIVYVISTSISSLYEINQLPVLQEINLPEAQGQIISLNRLLEAIGWGSGPLITGILISISGENYQIVALFIGIFAIPGIILWLMSFKWYHEDKEAISQILEERAIILKSNQKRRSE